MLNGAAIETLATKDDLRALGAELRTELHALTGMMLALQKLMH